MSTTVKVFFNFFCIFSSLQKEQSRSSMTMETMQRTSYIRHQYSEQRVSSMSMSRNATRNQILPPPKQAEPDPTKVINLWNFSISHFLRISLFVNSWIHMNSAFLLVYWNDDEFWSKSYRGLFYAWYIQALVMFHLSNTSYSYTTVSALIRHHLLINFYRLHLASYLNFGQFWSCFIQVYHKHWTKS